MSQENKPILELTGVSLGYGRRVVLPEVSLRLEQGRFIGLVGPNGSGKTTLIKTLLGIIRPLSGHLTLNSVSGHPAVLGYVPQTETLSPLFLVSGFEVALMGAAGRVRPGALMPRAEKQWVGECLDRAGATEFAHRRFSELSGGQKQRVLVARALVTRPDLLLLDEPTSGLDHAAAKGLAELLRRLHREEGLSILMVNHDLAMLRACVQDVLWIHNGKVSLETAGDFLAPGHIESLLEYSWN